MENWKLFSLFWFLFTVRKSDSANQLIQTGMTGQVGLVDIDISYVKVWHDIYVNEYAFVYTV